MLSQNILDAQSTYSLAYRSSHIFPTDKFLKGNIASTLAPIDRGQIIAFRWGQIFNRDNYWHQAYGKPTLGFGLEYFDIHNDEDIGNPFSVYGYWEPGLLYTTKSRLALTVDFGISFLWNEYNPSTNTDNISIGTDLNYFGGFGVKYYHKLHRDIHLHTAIHLNHHSNGAMVKPNLGVNLISAELGISVRPSNDLSTISYEPPTLKKWTFETAIYVGTRNHFPEGPQHSFYGTSLSAVRRFTPRLSAGAGLEYLYDSGQHEPWQYDNVSPRKSLSLYIFGRLHYRALSILLEAGHYTLEWNGTHPRTRDYQRLGLRYDITSSVFAAMKVRAFALRKADLLEFHVGYVF